MTQVAHTFAETATAMIGRKVEQISGVTTDSTVFAINSLSTSRTGKLKSGEAAPYVILKALEGDKTVEMHPEKASKLFKAGVEANMRILADIAAIPEGANSPVSTATVVADKPAEAAKPEVKADAAPAVPKDPSKKERAIKLVKAELEAKTERGVILTKLQTEIGLSKAGSATYFQNVKSKAVGWA